MYCKLNQCCCGCSLRTGTIAISAFSLISSFFTIIRIALNLSALKRRLSNDAEMLFDFNVGQLVGAMALMLMTFLVLFAAWKNRMPKLMLPWLIVQFVSLIVACSYLIFLAIEDIAAGGMGEVYLLAVCVGGVLEFYFWLVVLSYYQELKVKATTEQLPGEKATGQIQLC